MIRDGRKTIETRSWSTDYRGPLAICSSKTPKVPGEPCGFCLCVVDLVDCRPMTLGDEKAACCEYSDGLFSWVVQNVRTLRAFPVSGRQGLWDIEIDEKLFEETTVSNESNASVALPDLAAVFEAYQKLQAAKDRLAAARDEERTAKTNLENAKDERKAADSDLAKVKDEVLDLLGGIAPKSDAAVPMGMITPATPVGRRYKLSDSEEYVEYRGMDSSGLPQLVWGGGIYEGQPYFPAGGVTLDVWNKDYAPKVEGTIDKAPAADAAGPGEPAPADGDKPAATGPAEGDESWRTVRLAILKEPEIPAKVLAILQEHEPRIETVGDLADWVKAKGDYWGKDIKGIGPAGQGKIDEALEAFWMRRNGQRPG